jgi:hypothetical protein
MEASEIKKPNKEAGVKEAGVIKEAGVRSFIITFGICNPDLCRSKLLMMQQT